MKLFIILLALFSACSPHLKQDGDAYLYEGREQIIVSFRGEASAETADITAQMIKLLKDNAPKSDETILVEGLSDDYFYNFFRLGDALFLTDDTYKNKTIIYAYIAYLYQEFAQKHNLMTFIPVRGFQHFDKTGKSSPALLKSAVEYAVNDIFFVFVCT